MKKTININLAGQPFIIDEAAFDMLHSYLEALKLKFTDEAERREIMNDIESRVAEVFAQRLAKVRSVVSEEDVVAVIGLLGKPEDIAGETPTDTTQTKTESQRDPYIGAPREKKLFRDPDDQKVGGVISGLCHYFGWGDPNWVRIGVLVAWLLSLFLHLGLGFPILLLYFIILIVVPKAYSSADKLQMKGQPVTIGNIEKEVRDAMSNASDSIHTAITGRGFLPQLAMALLLILKAVMRIASVVVLIFLVMLLVVLTLLISGISMGAPGLMDLISLAVSHTYMVYIVTASAFILLAAPIASLLYHIIRHITGGKAQNRLFKNSLRLTWVIALIALILASVTIMKDYRRNDTISERVTLLHPSTGGLHIQLADSVGKVMTTRLNEDDNFNFGINIGGLAQTDYGFAFDEVKVEIAPSPDSNYYVERVMYSRGATPADADMHIRDMRYQFSQRDTILNLDNKFELPKGAKWRGQKLKIRIYVPEGKQVTMAENMDDIETQVKGNEFLSGDLLGGKALIVQHGKVECPSCTTRTIQQNMETDEDGEMNDNDTTHFPTHDVSVKINQNGVTVIGKDKNDEKVKLKIDHHGTSFIHKDSIVVKK